MVTLTRTGRPRRRRRTVVIVALAIVGCLALGQAQAASSFSAVEGAPFSAMLATSTCSISGSPTIDWGDGTSSAGTSDSSGAISGTHTYAEEGTFNGSVSWTDDCGSHTSPFTVVVADAPLSAAGASVAAIAGTSFSGVVATFSDADPGGVASDYIASIAWGDGTSSAGTVAPRGSSFVVSGTHTYAIAGSYSTGVSISDAGGASTVAHGTASVAPPPAVTSVAPNQGQLGGGNTVTISGSGFTGATAVQFGSTPATTFTVVSDTQITAVAPAGTGTVHVTVSGPAGSSTPTAADLYTYTSAPIVTGVNPSFGPPAGGTVVTVSGSGFSGATAVSFGSSPAARFSVVSDGQITATAPPGTGTVHVTVTGPGGTSTAMTANQYTYVQPAAPVVGNQPPQVQSSSAAAFAGNVNPVGLPTTAHFEYFLDSKYGPVTVDSTPGQQVGSDISSHAVSASVSGLLPNALYHVRLVASNSAGTTQGPDQTFMTAKDPPPPPPVLGKSFNAAPVSGLVFIKFPGHAAGDVGTRAASSITGRGFIPLTETRQLPTGTQVDSRRGTMGLVTATTVRHQTQAGQFGGTIFNITQARGGVGLTTLKLLSGAFPGAPSYTSCKRGNRRYSQTLHARTVAAAGARATIARGRRHENFRSSGHYSAATVRGTVWDTTDRCDGTLVVVHRGTVAVFDFVRHITVIVHTGHRYLAKAPHGR